MHKNHLVGMGIAPLQFLPGQNADTLELSGKERFTISIPQELTAGQHLTVQVEQLMLTWLSACAFKVNAMQLQDYD